MKHWIPITSVFHPRRGREDYMIVDEPPGPVWNGMSRADFLRIGVWIRWTADEMGLRDWRLQLKWEPADTDNHRDCYARIEVLEQVRTANIWVCEDFAFMEPQEQLRSICHELIHIHLDQLFNIGDKTIKDYMGQVGYDFFSEEFNRAIERATESMAMNWYHHLAPIPASLTADDGVNIRLRNSEVWKLSEYLEREE